MMRQIDLNLLSQALPDSWVPGEGLHLGGMIVGEAPGATEWEVKRPFQGDSGKFLHRELSAAGLNPADMYITNVVKVYPPIDGRKRDCKEPTKDQIEAALPYLIEEIQHVVPKYILALGSVAFHTLTGTNLGLNIYRGMWYRLDEKFDWDEALVLPTYHPAYVQRNRNDMNLLKTWRRDLTTFATVWLKGAPNE